MTLYRLLPCSLAFVALISTSFAAYADDSTNRAAAQTLYDDAVKLMEAGKLPEACKKLEDADHLVVGIGTRSRLGECYEKSSRFASAWTTYRSALSMAESKADARAGEIRDRTTALEPRLSKMRIDVPANARVAGLKIVRDGSELPESLWGSATPVDGGEHKVEATAPGKISWKTTVSVKGEKDSVVVTLVPLSTDPSAATPLVPTTKPTSSASPPPTPEPSHGGSSMKTAGWVIGGAGVALLGTGGILGLVAKSKYSSSDTGCGPDGCPKSSVDKADSARSLGNVATVVVIVGAAGLLTGGGLVLFAPSSSKSDSAKIEGGIAGPTGMFVRGRF